MERNQQIIEQWHQVSRCLFSSQAQDWLTVDLTMPQLKTLLCVAQAGDATSGQIARGLGVSLSTVTGIVDRLTEQHLVSRREDPEDRRVTRVLPTASGREMVRRLLRYRDERLTSLLGKLSPEELATVERAFEYLARAAAQVDELATAVGA